MVLVIDDVEEIDNIIVLKSDFKTINTFSLVTAMGYRGVSQSKLCKNIKGLSQPNLSKFIKGNRNVLSNHKLKEIMIYLDFPFDFLYKDIKKVKFL